MPIFYSLKKGERHRQGTEDRKGQGSRKALQGEEQEIDGRFTERRQM